MMRDEWDNFNGMMVGSYPLLIFAMAGKYLKQKHGKMTRENYEKSPTKKCSCHRCHRTKSGEVFPAHPLWLPDGHAFRCLPNENVEGPKSGLNQKKR